MDHPGLVRCAERARDVDEPRELARSGDAIVPDIREERLPGHELHHDVEDALGLPEVVDRHRVGVREDGGRPRFAEEPGHRLGMIAIGPQDLERHLAPQPRVDGAIDFAHAAAADERLDRVTLERLSYGDRHESGG